MIAPCQNIYFIHFRGGYLFMKEVCLIYHWRCSIFYASNVSTDGNPLKLPRDKEVVPGSDVETTVFDYARFFHPALERYNKGHGLIPEPSVYVMFGCARKISELNESVPIYAKVTSVQAERECSSASEIGVSIHMTWETCVWNSANIFFRNTAYLSLEKSILEGYVVCG